MSFQDDKVADPNMPQPWFQRLEAKLQRIKIKNLLGRQFLAEFLGTFILVVSFENLQIF